MAGTNNIKVTSVENISVGDKIRVGHGIETVTVTRVGTAAKHTNLASPANIGATSLRVRDAHEFSAADSIMIGTPVNQESVTVTSVSQSRSGSRRRGTIEFTPALKGSHIADEGPISPGAGLDLAKPLQYTHSANLPLSDRGAGVTFKPATALAHMSNEPVQALGTGIVLDGALSNHHRVDAVVQDASVTTVGYQGTPQPNQWFGGPDLTVASPLFGRTITLREGSMVLRNAAGLVVDSPSYGSLANPWAALGDQSVSEWVRAAALHLPLDREVDSDLSTLRAQMSVPDAIRMGEIPGVTARISGAPRQLFFWRPRRAVRTTSKSRASRTSQQDKPFGPIPERISRPR